MSVWPLPRITFRELSSVEEKRPVALLTSDTVWAAISTQLTLPVLIQAEPAQHDRSLFDYLADNLPSQVQAIYAVGGGAVIEAGKYVAGRNDTPLIIVPTALDSDAMLRSAALVEEKTGETRRVINEITGPASEVIIDWDVIQSAPEHLRGAGIVDVLAVVTGLLDWRYAATKSKNPREQRFMPWAAGVVTGLVKEAIKDAAAIGQGTQEALRLLLDSMAMTVQVSNQLGHARAAQGSEHYLAQILAGTTRFSLPHAEFVGPCLTLASALHGQAPDPLKSAMEAAGVRLDQVRATDINLVIDKMDAYLAAYELPYSILNDIVPDSVETLSALETAGLAIEKETWQKVDDTGPVEAILSEPVEAPVDQKEGDTRPADDTSDLDSA